MLERFQFPGSFSRCFRRSWTHQLETPKTSKNWASVWLKQLSKWWSDLSKVQGVTWGPDFLLPTIYPKTGVSKPQPMAHYQASIWLRMFLEHPGGIKPTLHNLKAGMVAIGKQLSLPEEWLSEQAHHAPKRSTATYTRDDTFFQLRLQVTIMQYLQKGWRPAVPQLRGSDHPSMDEEFECSDWLTWDWLFPNPLQVLPTTTGVPGGKKDTKESEEVESSSSSTSSDDSLFYEKQFPNEQSSCLKKCYTSPSKIKWDLTNGPLSKLIELLL